MILLLDHEDSFVFTLAAYVLELGVDAEVVRAGSVTLQWIASRAPERIVLSPGPCTPRECPETLEVIHAFGPTIPILGVCLGHQCIAAAYGANVQRAAHPRHGMTSSIAHDGRGVFAGIPTPLVGTRYHSLAVARESIPSELECTAVADDGEVMGLRHRRFPVEGVQFHPESILTEWGHRLLANFLRIDGERFGRVAK